MVQCEMITEAVGHLPSGLGDAKNLHVREEMLERAIGAHPRVGLFDSSEGLTASLVTGQLAHGLKTPHQGEVGDLVRTDLVHDHLLQPLLCCLHTSGLCMGMNDTVVGNPVRLDASCANGFEPLQSAWAITRMGACMKHCVEAHQVGFEASLGHFVHPKLCALNVARLSACMDQRPKRDVVKLASICLHPLEPRLRSLEGASLCPSIDHAVV
mmetsp:Transcript_3439/g.8877  ORF Transcript_3439/g.8877 Transcript_3439/m.8877 type:complete len:212 (-) Transcript_3439:314-949(-)